MRRRLILVVCVLLWWTLPTRAVDLLLDGFEASLRVYWSSYAGPGSSGVVSRTDEIAGPDASTYVVKSVASAIWGSAGANTDPWYGTYLDFQPWEAAQGDRYLYERLLDAGWVGGANRVLEFYIRPDSRYDAPISIAGLFSDAGGEYLSIGSYTMGPSVKGMGNQEGNGYHGYHTLPLPGTGDRWIKVKALRMGGPRTTGNLPPAMRGIVDTTNGTPFQLAETITCSPSGRTMIFAHEGEHAVVGQIVVFAFWTSLGVLPTTSDTCTGGTSSAERTFLEVTQYSPGTYGDNALDALGNWAGHWAPWVTEGGYTLEWHDDYTGTPTATYWDRVTRLYIAVAGVDVATPVTDYFDKFVLTDDDRDDIDAISNIAAFYHDEDEKLWLGWQRNVDLVGKTWEIRTSASDIHTGGWSSATAWQTQADCSCVYTGMAKYAAFTPPAQTFYVAVKPTDRATFTQITITLPEAPAGGVVPGRSLRGRRR